MRVELTDRFLKSIPIPETGRVEGRDTKRPGLTLRIYASGRKVWHFEKRVKGGPKRKHKLGEYPQPVGLSQARALALDIASTANKGIDEAAEAKEAKLREEAARALRDKIARSIRDLAQTERLVFSVGSATWQRGEKADQLALRAAGRRRARPQGERQHQQ